VDCFFLFTIKIYILADKAELLSFSNLVLSGKGTVTCLYSSLEGTGRERDSL